MLKNELNIMGFILLYRFSSLYIFFCILATRWRNFLYKIFADDLFLLKKCCHLAKFFVCVHSPLEFFCAAMFICTFVCMYILHACRTAELLHLLIFNSKLFWFVDFFCWHLLNRMIYKYGPADIWLSVCLLWMHL